MSKKHYQKLPKIPLKLLQIELIYGKIWIKPRPNRIAAQKAVKNKGNEKEWTKIWKTSVGYL